MKNSLKNYLGTLLSGALLLLWGCATQENNAANRRLQNLSARYNYVYNANILLQEYESSLSERYKDDYSQLLPLFMASEGDGSSDDAGLETIRTKARAIITEKNVSNYLDEAYMLLGKTDFYKGNYYSAAEYFGYVERAYRSEKKVYLDALNWKARTYMQLQNEEMVAHILDSARVMLDSVKRHKAETLATLAAFSIRQQKYKTAIQELSAALRHPENREQKLRWTYTLAQLHEQEGDKQAALKAYSQLAHSNASFELYFNALLHQVRLSEQLKPNPLNRVNALLKLVKDDKNTDYVDQIYYTIAQDYRAEQKDTLAEKYYQLALSGSRNNAIQKGLAYLQLADLHFSRYNQYPTAKLYYDSALAVLPPNYPHYEQWSKKALNLNYLSERLEIIHTQDTLQALAALPEKERAASISRRFTVKAQMAAAAERANDAANTPYAPNTPYAANSSGAKNSSRAASAGSGNTFYFSNTTAVSRGYNDFLKRWGKRAREDNWRQSVKSSNILGREQADKLLAQADAGDENTGQSLSLEEQVAAYIARLPLSPEALAQSNQMVEKALFEIGAFYQQELNDPQEAVKTYETLLQRFPESPHLESIYYSLYLAYQNSNPEKSAQYKAIVLGRYPASVYAKTILDPQYSSQQNALNLEINKQYNATFELYARKAYPEVIKKVNEINQRFPGNSLQIQYDYLKAIAIGKTAPVDSLLGAFGQIIKQYPADSLISPLIKDHLSYIEAHLPALKARKIALIDFDENEPRFVSQGTLAAAGQTGTPQGGTRSQNGAQQATETGQTGTPQGADAKTAGNLADPTARQNASNLPPGQGTANLPPGQGAANPATGQGTANPADSSLLRQGQQPKETESDGLFTTAASNTYYYAISVATMETSLSSSRFGLGQFNRGNYSGSNLKHNLIDLDMDQVIYVGDFNSLSEVQAYSNEIKAQLGKIMKVSAKLYQSFYISKENFDKIKDRASLNRYLTFYKAKIDIP